MRVRRTAVDPIDFHIGSRLRQARLLAGMSQNQLGKLYGVSFQQVQKNERGINRISASGLLRLANILHVPLLYFYEGLSADVLNGAAVALVPEKMDFSKQREAMEIVRLYFRIDTPEKRRAFGNVLRTFVE